MKKYNITVNGKTYQVEVEEVRGAQAEAVSQAAASPQTAPATAPAAVSEPAAGTAGASPYVRGGNFRGGVPGGRAYEPPFGGNRR